MDRSIITAAAGGDKKAFRTIFNFFVPKLRPVALRYARTDFEAEDILQEAFVKVYNNLNTYKFQGSFEGWIKRIVINTALNHYDKHKKDYQLDSIENVEEEDLGIEEAKDIDEIEPSLLLSIFQNLPDGYRIVMNLYVLEDYSHKEIAQMLGISEGSSRSQFSKARKYIKKVLAGLRNDNQTNLLNKDTTLS
jgi:RNA polymerase sigma factor (sigma-70 family)